MNRDPVNPAALASAAAAWLASQDDEADIALEGALLLEGVISPADVIESLGVDHGPTIYVKLESGESFRVTTDGTTF